MRMIYIANARIPTEKAHGLQIMKMCEAFAREGVDVELVVAQRLNPIKTDPFDYYSVKRNFKITRLPCVDLIPLDFILGKLAFWVQATTFLTSAKIYLIFRKYDFLYTRDSLVGTFFKNFIYEIHALPEKANKHKKIFQKAAKLIVLTDCIKRELIEVGVDENKIHISPDAVDIDIFHVSHSKLQVRQELNLPLDKKLVGYVGMFRTMGMGKGITVLIDALQYLSEDVSLVLVGGSPGDVEYYRSKAKMLNVTHCVIFTGRVPHRDIPIYLHAFDVAAAPYPKGKHYECYMSPLKIFEYMASGVPIVASDLPSLREVLNENNAVLVEPDKTEALAGGVKRILENQDASQKLAECAYKDVQKYTWQERAQKIIDFISK